MGRKCSKSVAFHAQLTDVNFGGYRLPLSVTELIFGLVFLVVGGIVAGLRYIHLECTFTYEHGQGGSGCLLEDFQCSVIHTTIDQCTSTLPLFRSKTALKPGTYYLLYTVSNRASMFPLVRSTLSYADLTTPYFNLDIFNECMRLTTKGNRPSTYMCEENRVDLDNEWYYPCGFLPYSVFTDTFQLLDNNNVSVPLLTDATSLNIPRQYHDDFVQEQKGAVNWLCPRIFPLAVKDPHFVVWTLPYDGPVASRPWAKFTITEETSLPLRVSS